MATIDINEFATYGLMAQSLDTYFKNSSNTEYTPPGGFYQNFHMKTKKKKYNKDAIPNAWVKEDSNLYFNQQDGEKKSISDFINKDEKTLKYFWEWAQNNEGEGDDGLPANTKDSNPSIVRIDPSWGMDAVPGYKYTKNKFDHINYNDRINMYTLGEDGISTDNIKKLGYNPETNDTQSKLQVTDLSLIHI